MRTQSTCVGRDPLAKFSVKPLILSSITWLVMWGKMFKSNHLANMDCDNAMKFSISILRFHKKATSSQDPYELVEKIKIILGPS